MMVWHGWYGMVSAVGFYKKCSLAWHVLLKTLGDSIDVRAHAT